jgi:hypothetical protein
MGMVIHICDRNDRRIFTDEDAPIIGGEKESKISAPCSYWSEFAFDTQTVEVMDQLFPAEGEIVDLTTDHLRAFIDAWRKKKEIPEKHHAVMLWFLFWISHSLLSFEEPIVVHN